jgi:Fe-Mn family superoxide dismutase
MDRREAIAIGATMLAGSMLHANEEPKSIKINAAYGVEHVIIPLPFDPVKLKGISEKVIVSHHQNNYSGAVKKLNLIQKQIASMPQSAHPIEYGALKKEELIALNSKLLHELYFSNLGGDAIMPSMIQTLLIQTFGSIDAWKYDFIKTAQSLSGGSGWVVLSYLKEPQIMMHQIASDHTDSIATGIPLLVLDMYEHSYQMDYGAKAAAYIDAFIENINWSVVADRFKAA